MKLLSPRETGSLLGISVNTLAVWRCTGRYPLNFIRVGNRIKYRLEDIESFIQNRMQNGLRDGE